MRVFSKLALFLMAWFAKECEGIGIECTKEPCAINDTSLRFFAIGDWGGAEEPPFITPGQQSCANLIGNMGLDKRPQFFIATGDNFYENGVQNAEDPRFKHTFDDVFLYGKEDAVPWYVVAGNHDWYGNISAQIEYSNLNRRWIFPALTYSATYDASPTGPIVDIIYIDTVTLCGNTWDDDLKDIDSQTGKKGKRTKDPRGPSDKDRAEKMWWWIKEKMANSTADYLFAVGHYPAFAADRHNISSCLVPRLQDLLEAYNATAYISGHSHNLQHIKTVSSSGNVVHHVISGGGHTLNPSHHPFELTHNPWQLSSEFFFPTKRHVRKKNKDGQRKMGGLVYVDLKKKSGIIEYYHCEGEYLYHFEVQPRFI